MTERIPRAHQLDFHLVLTDGQGADNPEYLRENRHVKLVYEINQVD